MELLHNGIAMADHTDRLQRIGPCWFGGGTSTGAITMCDVDTWEKPIPFSWILFPHSSEPIIGIVYPDGYCRVFGDVNHYRPDEFKVLGPVVPCEF